MSKIIQPGDKIFLLLSPNHKDKYRYVEGVVKEISNDIGRSKVTLNLINLDDIYKVPRSKRLGIDDLTHLCITVTYGEHSCTYINNESKITKLYTENELDKLIEDVNNLNDILEVRRLHKQIVQEYIDTKLENWNYRGDINV